MNTPAGLHDLALRSRDIRATAKLPDGTYHVQPLLDSAIELSVAWDDLIKIGTSVKREHHVVEPEMSFRLVRLVASAVNLLVI